MPAISPEETPNLISGQEELCKGRCSSEKETACCFLSGKKTPPEMHLYLAVQGSTAQEETSLCLGATQELLGI